jgi:drug/metabolite transporter (DMT)-like permease
MKDTSNNSPLPVIALIIAVLLWGGSFAGMRVSLQILSPWTVMWCRMITALVLLLPFTFKSMIQDYTEGDWKLILPMVLFQPCIYFYLETHALQLTTSSQAGIISASVPLLVAIGAWLAFSEKITLYSIFGLALSVTGVVLLTLFESPGGSAENALMGNTLEFLAMASAAANMIIVKKLSQRYNPWTITGFQVIAGSVFFLPGVYEVYHYQSVGWTIQLVTILILLGALVTLGAFGLYNWGISRIPASRASAFINLIPVTAILIGWSLLNETLNILQICSAMVVILGVIISQRANA